MNDPRSWHRTVVILALTTALLTAAGIAFLGGGRTLYLAGSAAYVALTAAAVALPVAVVLQTVTGLTLAGALVLAGEPTSLQLVPLVAGIVAGAELLAVVARLESPTVRHPSSGLVRALAHAAVGCGVFLIVAVVSRLPGPTGLVAVALAAAACAGLAALLVRTVSPDGTVLDSGQ